MGVVVWNKVKGMYRVFPKSNKKWYNIHRRCVVAIVRIELDETTHKRLKILAIERGTSLKELIPMILREYSTKKALKELKEEE